MERTRLIELLSRRTTNSHSDLHQKIVGKKKSKITKRQNIFSKIFLFSVKFVKNKVCEFNNKICKCKNNYMKNKLHHIKRVKQVKSTFTKLNKKFIQLKNK